jgi:hypothetical protein
MRISKGTPLHPAFKTAESIVYWLAPRAGVIYVAGDWRFAFCFMFCFVLVLIPVDIPGAPPRPPSPPESARSKTKTEVRGPKAQVYLSCGWACSRFPVFFSRARAPSHAFSHAPSSVLSDLGSRSSAELGVLRLRSRESGEARSLCLYNICFKAVADISLAVGARPLHPPSTAGRS